MNTKAKPMSEVELSMAERHSEEGATFGPNIVKALCKEVRRLQQLERDLLTAVQCAEDNYQNILGELHNG